MFLRGITSFSVIYIFFPLPLYPLHGIKASKEINAIGSSLHYITCILCNLEAKKKHESCWYTCFPFYPRLLKIQERVVNNKKYVKGFTRKKS